MEKTNLAQQIKKYYYSNIGDLPKQKQEHFLTRMLASSGEPEARQLLAEFRNYWIGKNMKTTFREFKFLTPDKSNQFYTIRKPFFDKYSNLYGADWGLTRLRRLYDVLGLDYKNDYFEVFNKSELLDIASQILSDDNAIRALSTYAVTMPMMLSQVLFNDFRLIDFDKIYSAGKNYDFLNKKNLLLLCYLYTHCIVYASNLYTNHVPKEFLPIFQKMLLTLDSFISKDFNEITIDVKLETILCANICSMQMSFEENAIEECLQSIKSDSEIYIADPRKPVVNLSSAEHCNALFIMATQEYSPHSVLAV